MASRQLQYAEFVRSVLDALEAAGVPYMIGGAVAVWAWGEPRATLDLDLVVDIPLEAIQRLSTELEERDMHVPADLILDAILEDRADLPINAIHMYTGLKAEMYLVRPDDALRQSAMNRRQLVDMGPDLGTVYLHSPEDLILYKLMYYGLSQQTKHLRDIRSMLASLEDQLDRAYVTGWAQRLGLNALWDAIQSQPSGWGLSDAS